MEPISDPKRIVQLRPNQSNLVQSHVLPAVTKPLRVMKLIVDQTPTKNINKFINGVNDFTVGQQPYSIVGHKGKVKDVGQQPYPSAVRVSDANSIRNVSDADPNHSNVRLIRKSNQPTSHSNVRLALRVSNQSRKQPPSDFQPPSDIDPRVTSVMRTLQMEKSTR